VLTQALPLSDAITRTTTEVTVTPRREPSVGYDNAAALFALLERALPAELDSVRARFAAEKQAKEKAKARKKKRSKK
jgi:predicted amidophosphoribosyltransferase